MFLGRPSDLDWFFRQSGQLLPDAWEALAQPADEAAALLDKYRVQSHYLVNGCFWGAASLLERARLLERVPTAIPHGRLDWICRPQAAWAPHQALPGSKRQWVEGCGHSPVEPAMAWAFDQAVAHDAWHGGFSG